MSGKNQHNYRSIIGQIELGETVMVTDPCYGYNQWCCNSMKIKPGTYDVIEHYCNKEHERPTALEIRNILHKEVTPKTKAGFSVSVDAGMVSFIDKEDYLKHHGPDEVHDDWWEKVCKETIIRKGDGHLILKPYVEKHGVASNTFMGDGTYKVRYGINEDEEVVSVKIIHG